MVDRFERFSLAISEISRHWHKLASGEMKRYGLRGAHAIYLLAMLRYPEGISAPKLCELCCKDKSDVSRMLSIMEEKGYVTKEESGGSLYRGLFKLTDAGHTVAQEVCGRASLAVALAGGDLATEKREVLYEALESIAANLRKLSKKGLPRE